MFSFYKKDKKSLRYMKAKIVDSKFVGNDSRLEDSGFDEKNIDKDKQKSKMNKCNVELEESKV